MMRAALIAALTALSPTFAEAQIASLVADRVFIEGDRELIAEGNVEVLFDDARLTATRITYDRETESLAIDGPLALSEGTGAVVVLADQAQLEADLQRGILRGARLVFEQQLQLAAAEIARVSGRYTRLSRVTASSCEVCSRTDTPLWEIRAAQVIRDEEERMLYFDEAQFRVAGVPVFYLPRLRLPDTTRDRATGFLAPSLISSTTIGTGLQIPYFIAIGDHADLTFAPFFATDSTTLETIYRQEFRYGNLRVDAAVSSDDLDDGGLRGYLFADGIVYLPRDYQLTFDLELVSDESYLFDYGYSEQDRLATSVFLQRTRDNQLFRTGITSFRTLRASEVPTERELPQEIVEFDLRYRLVEDPLWGQLWAFADAASIARPSSTPGVGRDVARVGAGLNWWSSTTFQNGLVADAEAEAAVELYNVSQDQSFEDQVGRTRLGSSLTFRLPLQRTGADGAHHLLEPLLQVAWADAIGDDVPNEDSTVVEFDEGNLLSLSRFPGTDAYEEGLRLNFGARWTRYDPTGWSLDFTAGRIYRFSGPDQFGADTGLSGESSNWLFAVQYSLGNELSAWSRALVDDDLDLDSAETRFEWQTDRLELAGTHLWRAAEPLEGRADDLSELTLDGGYQVTDRWSAAAEWRFDADSSKTTRAGVGVGFENECVRMDLSLSRRFTSSTNVEPATELDLRVALTGFGNNQGRRVRKKCRG